MIRMMLSVMCRVNYLFDSSLNKVMVHTIQKIVSGRDSWIGAMVQI